MIIFESLAPTNINQLQDELIAQIPEIHPTEDWNPLIVQSNGYITQILARVELPEALIEAIQAVAAQHRPQIKHAPQWDAFYRANQKLLLGLIGQSPQQVIASALMHLFSRRRDPNFNQEVPDLMGYWNLAIAPLLEAETIETLEQGIETYHLPLKLTSEGRLIEVD